MIPELRNRIHGKKIVILGVGNPLRGDDGAGPALVERLQGKTSATLVNAGDVPENYLGVVTSAKPDLVLIVDAVEMGANPGDLALIEGTQLGGAQATTHNTSLALFARVLQVETGAEILVVGIQPGVISFGEPLSIPMTKTLQNLVILFQDLLDENQVTSDS